MTERGTGRWEEKRISKHLPLASTMLTDFPKYLSGAHNYFMK